MKNIELLAPVGNSDSLNVAIYNGADAIYLGLSNFNARANAQNFDDSTIFEVTRFAHLYGLKVYVTINTLINDSEFPEFLEMVKTAVEAKVDAFIIQDIGVASILKSAFPNIVMHASTQMGIHNLDGAIQAEKLGFSRVVLSREVKLEDIKLIKKHTNLELEYFVQGALCVAFSGNCYFSSLCHNKSGNRGKCLQLCRLPYSYDKQNYAYYLSPADLSLINSLNELIDAGITSFKIEGRLRRPAYVAQSIQSYRSAIDSLLKNEKFNYEKHLKYLAKVFNRGEYNERAYLDKGTPDNIINTTCNNHIGVPIGKVLDVQKFKNIYKITLSSSHAISTNDGLKFFFDGKEVGSAGVGNVEQSGKNYIIYSKYKFPLNSQVNLIVDSERENYLTNIIKRLKIDARIYACVGKNLQAELNYKDISIIKSLDYICPQAQKSPTTKEEIIAQFSKLNDTHFELSNIVVEIDSVFIPKSILNSLRRLAVEMLENAIINDNEKGILAKYNDEFSFPKIKIENQLNKNIVLISNIDDLSIISKDNLVVFAPQKYDLSAVEQIEKINSLGYEVGFYLPIIANHLDIEIIDNILSKLSFKPYIISNNLWGLKYLKNYRVIANYNHNIFNSFSAKCLFDMGVVAIVQSIESESTFQENLHSFIGYPSLMTFSHCPYKTKNKTTCAKCDYNGDMTLFDGKQTPYKIYRTQVGKCYFDLISSMLYNGKSKYKFVDLRAISKKEKNNLDF